MQPINHQLFKVSVLTQKGWRWHLLEHRIKAINLETAHRLIGKRLPRHALSVTVEST